MLTPAGAEVAMMASGRRVRTPGESMGAPGAVESALDRLDAAHRSLAREVEADLRAGDAMHVAPLIDAAAASVEGVCRAVRDVRPSGGAGTLPDGPNAGDGR